MLDVRDVFYRLILADDAIPLLNIRVWGFEEFRFLKATKGLAVSPTWWCHLIEQVVKATQRYMSEAASEDLPRTKIVVYAGDILLAGECKVGTEMLLQVMLQVLKHAYMLVILEKVQDSSKRNFDRLWVFCNTPVSV